MKTWKDLSGIPMPASMGGLPIDKRGYPTPWIAAVGSDGKADFRVLDEEKVAMAVKHRVCAICGTPIEGPVAFVGGRLSMGSHAFTDPGMHPECARYAIQVCPFLAAPKFAYSRHAKPMKGMVMKTLPMSDKRPTVFGLGTTATYTLMALDGGAGHVILADKWITTEWWAEGKEVTTEALQDLVS